VRKVLGWRAIAAASISGMLGVVGISIADGGWEFDLEFGDFSGPPGIAVDSQGEVYAGDNQVQVFTPDGQFLRESTGFNDPRGIAIDENDVLYVLEPCRVHRYTLDFQPLGSWDSCIGQGDLQHGRGIDVQNGIIYIATVGNVLKFTTEGAFLGQFQAGWSDVHIVSDGSIWVVRTFEDVGLVRHYSSGGEVLGQWNTILPDEGSSSPVAITVDSRGQVFVADGRVKIFTTDGVLEDLIEVQFRPFFEVELDGDSLLYIGAAFPDRVMRFHYKVFPVEPATWGGIKTQYR